jgi:hypothetical protein
MTFDVRDLSGATPSDPYAVRDFEAFWPHYVRLHTRPETQWAHALATATCAALIAAGVARRRLLWLALAPVANHLIAQASHRRFEKNRTLPWRNTAWHTRAELRMLRLVLTGRMASEVARYAVSPRV